MPAPCSHQVQTLIAGATCVRWTARDNSGAVDIFGRCSCGVGTIVWLPILSVRSSLQRGQAAVPALHYVIVEKPIAL